MKKYFLLLIVILTFNSCVKYKCAYTSSNVVASEAEVSYIQTYLSDNAITNFVKHPCGVFYKIDSVGSGNTPELCSNILVKYSVVRLDTNVQFDSSPNPGASLFTLGQLIEGVKKVMPLIKSGGGITMYIPPSLAYGSQDIKDPYGVVVLPANTYIKFSASLLEVN